MNVLVTALVSIALSVAAQFVLRLGMLDATVRDKLSAGWSLDAVRTVALTPAIGAGFALYGIGAAVWLSVLAKWDVSKAYPLVGIGFLLSCVLGMALGEGVTVQRVLGCLVITAGVVLVART